MWLLVLRRLDFSLGESAPSSRHRHLHRFVLIRVGEGISGSRQGERSRAHSGALNVSGVWIKMDLRGGSSPALACRGLRFLSLAQLFIHPCIMACSWLNPSCQRLEKILEIHVIVGARSHSTNLTP